MYVCMYVQYLYIIHRHHLRVYLHNYSSVHPSSPAQLCASHKEELADLNTRLSAQEEEMCQKAQLVITLQVRTYVCTYVHTYRALECSAFIQSNIYHLLFLPSAALSTCNFYSKYGSTYVRTCITNAPSLSHLSTACTTLHD